MELKKKSETLQKQTARISFGAKMTVQTAPYESATVQAFLEIPTDKWDSESNKENFAFLKDEVYAQLDEEVNKIRNNRR